MRSLPILLALIIGFISCGRTVSEGYSKWSEDVDRTPLVFEVSTDSVGIVRQRVRSYILGLDRVVEFDAPTIISSNGPLGVSPPIRVHARFEERGDVVTVSVAGVPGDGVPQERADRYARQLALYARTGRDLDYYHQEYGGPAEE